MTARAFAEFLKADFKQTIEAIEANLKNVAYDKMEVMHRQAGVASALTQICDGMDNILKIFHEKMNNDTLNEGK